MALSQIGADNASRTTAGSSLTPTGRAFNAGDLLVATLWTTLNETTEFTSFKDLATQTINLTDDSRGMVKVGERNHSSGAINSRTVIYAGVASTSMAITDWRFGYNANSHGGCYLAIFRADETFDAWDGTNHLTETNEGTSATSATATAIDPPGGSSTGIMLHAVTWTANDTTVTNTSPWTATRAPLNVASSPRCVCHLQRSFRTDDNPVTPSVTGITSSNITNVAVWIPTGAGVTEQEIDPNFIASAATIYSPKISHKIFSIFIPSAAQIFTHKISSKIAPNLVSGGAIYSPTVKTINTIAPELITGGQVYTHKVSHVIEPDFISDSAVYDPEIVFEPKITPGFISDGAVYSPKISHKITVDHTDSGEVYNPKVSLGISSSFIDSLATVYSPSILQGITPSFVSNGIVYSPKINHQIYPNAISGGITYSPTLAHKVEPSFIASSATVYQPKILQSVNPGLISNGTVYSPKIHHKIYPNLVSSATVYRPIIVAEGADLIIEPELVSGGATYQPKISHKIYVNTITSVETVYSPSVTQKIQPSLISNGEVFSPKVSHVIEPDPISSGQVFTPNVQIKIELDFIPGGQTYDPSIGHKIYPDFVSTGQTYPPVVGSFYVIQPGFIYTGAVYVPSVALGIHPDLIDGSQVYIPRIDGGLQGTGEGVISIIVQRDKFIDTQHEPVKSVILSNDEVIITTSTE